MELTRKCNNKIGKIPVPFIYNILCEAIATLCCVNRKIKHLLFAVKTFCISFPSNHIEHTSNTMCNLIDYLTDMVLTKTNFD